MIKVNHNFEPFFQSAPRNFLRHTKSQKRHSGANAPQLITLPRKNQEKITQQNKTTNHCSSEPIRVFNNSELKGAHFGVFAHFL